MAFFYALIMSYIVEQTSVQIMFVILKATIKSYTVYFYFLKSIKEVGSCYQNVANNLCTNLPESFKTDF